LGQLSAAQSGESFADRFESEFIHARERVHAKAGEVATVNLPPMATSISSAAHFAAHVARMQLRRWLRWRSPRSVTGLFRTLPSSGAGRRRDGFSAFVARRFLSLEQKFYGIQLGFSRVSALRL
jgi:hypothetical protein